MLISVIALILAFSETLGKSAQTTAIDKNIEAGPVRLSVFKRTVRCDATNVDPATAGRDMAIPQVLLRTFGHSDFGVYAKVERGGMLKAGDTIKV